MIARMWQARTGAPEKYHQVFETEVLADLQGIDGFRGAYLLARQDRITTLTLFETLDAIKRFAGPDHEREHVTPAARATLLDSDPVIRHYDVLTAFRTP
jgi:heme-degrading monooxygenase HmoA